MKKLTNPNTDARNLTLAKSYEEEADDIMIWGNWYLNQGDTEKHRKHVKMAKDRYNHARKLRTERER